METKLLFGLNSENVPKDGSGVWGARAIFHPHDEMPLEVLPNRQDTMGDPEEIKEITAFLKSYWPLIQDLARNAYLNGDLKPDKRYETQLFGHKVKILANTNASHGYVYLAAFLTRDDQ